MHRLGIGPDGCIRKETQVVFNELPTGSHVDLVIETHEVREAAKMCADITVQGWYRTVYCQLESWQQLMET
jgi:ABC-type proline/glycine betaine transport system ATPase subunit